MPIRLEDIIETEQLLETLSRGGWAAALGVGVGVALLLGRGARPVAKQAIKGYLAATEGVRKATAGAREGLQDIYAEAKAERETAHQTQSSQASAQS